MCMHSIVMLNVAFGEKKTYFFLGAFLSAWAFFLAAVSTAFFCFSVGPFFSPPGVAGITPDATRVRVRPHVKDNRRRQGDRKGKANPVWMIGVR